MMMTRWHSAPHLLHDVRAQQNGFAATQLTDQSTDIGKLIWIKAARRLIEHQHRWIVHQRLRQPNALPITFGELANGFADFLRQPDLLHQLVDACFGLLDLLQPGRVEQVFAHVEIGVEGIVLGQITYESTHLRRCWPHRLIVQIGSAGARLQKAREHAHGSRLARPIRSEKACHTDARAKTHLIDGTLCAKLFGQSFEAYLHKWRPQT